MTTLALIAAACIWFAAGYLAAEIVRVARRIATLDRAEATLADGDELLCINAAESPAATHRSWEGDEPQRRGRSASQEGRRARPEQQPQPFRHQARLTGARVGLVPE